MNRLLVVLVLLTGLIIQLDLAPLLREPPAVPPMTFVVEIIRPPPPCFHGLIRAMHAGRSDTPHLFTRFYAFWLTCMIKAQVFDAELAKPQARRMVRYMLTLQAERARQTYFDLGHARDMTADDWEAYRIAVEMRGCKLILTDWAHMMSSIAGYSPTLHVIQLPENKLAPSGLPPRLVALHEFAHLVQHCLLQAGYAEAAEGFHDLGTDSLEIAAMVVETAQLIHDGLTRKEAEAMDSWPSAGDGAPPWEPRMSGGLVWDYVKRYGPHISGDFTRDLLTVERWVKNAEVMSRSSAVDDFIPPARAAIESGETTDLAAAFQTFLAVNGEPSWFPIEAADLLEGPAFITESTSILANVPQERRAAVEDFLYRCGGP